MHSKQYFGLCLVALVLCQSFALPQQASLQRQIEETSRKFAEKPNAMKKVGLDDIDDISNNSIADGNSGGFTWSSILSMLMQMILGQNANIASPSKNEIDDGVPASPWTNILSVGLRVLTAFLGGPQQQVDGIDKVDNQSSSPMQGILTAVLGAFLGQGRNPEQVSMIAGQASEFINIVINLLDALKTSFSHRSLQARSLGKKDTVSDAAVASISMLKGYVRSMKSFKNVGRSGDKEDGQKTCAERTICEANAECAADSQGNSSIFCQLGSFFVTRALHSQSGVSLEELLEAGKRGRAGESCRIWFADCNEIF